MSLVAIVTGTGRGLGKAVHEALLAHGIATISVARSPAADDGAAHITADLAKQHDWPGLVGPILSQFGFTRIVFFDIAAILPAAAVGEEEFEPMLEEAMRVNVTTPLAIARALLREARRRDATLDIVHVSSGAAFRPVPGWGAYCASKAAAVLAWLGFEAENDRVHAHIFQPGVMATEMQAGLRARNDPSAAPVEALRDPAEVADEMLQLCGIAA